MSEINTLAGDAASTSVAPAPADTAPEITFADLGLAPELLRAVLDEGYTKPTPIQAHAIPLVISGKDIMGGAQTGTGHDSGDASTVYVFSGPRAVFGGAIW